MIAPCLSVALVAVQWYDTVREISLYTNALTSIPLFPHAIVRSFDQSVFQPNEELTRRINIVKVSNAISNDP